jgi:hypothetical protein
MAIRTSCRGSSHPASIRPGLDPIFQQRFFRYAPLVELVLLAVPKLLAAWIENGCRRSNLSQDALARSALA